MWPLVVALLVCALALQYGFGRRRQTRMREDNARLKSEAGAAAAERERALAGVRAQQQTFFNSMSEGVLVLDAGQRVQLANRALQDLTGVGEEDRGRSILESFRMHELDKFVKDVAARRAASAVELDWPGQEARTFLVNAAPILEEGDLRGLVLVFHDQTRIRQLESTRQEFVANVSHELRTPLSLIKGYVETLLDGAKDDPAVAGRFLQKILRHADRLAFLIEDLLTLSQLESGRAILNWQRVRLDELILRVLDDLESPATTKGITLRHEVQPGLTARADADRLQQVLSNLVDNGIKYGRPNGSVGVNARTLENGEIEISVRDDGPGIPPEFVERIFERFYRVDRARSREQGGTGLGLSIVKHIVQSHGGRVRVESAMGQGSTFYVTLPPEPA